MSINYDELKNEIVKAPLIRRFGAFLTDLFLLVLVFLALNAYVISPLLSKSYNYTELTVQYVQRKIDSHLYVEYNEDIVEYIDVYDPTLDNQFEFYNNVDERLIDFYTDFENDNIQIDDYNKSKLESLLFEFDDNGNVVLKETTTVIQLTSFYNEEFDKALSLFSNNDDYYMDLARKITIFDIISIFISLTISFLILYLIIPICMKNGETLGKLLLSIGVVSLKDGFRVRKSQIIVRFVILYLFEIILSIFLIAIPLIVSFSMIIFNKKALALHDYFAATICVDKKQCLIYKDYDEFIKHEQVLLK